MEMKSMIKLYSQDCSNRNLFFVSSSAASNLFALPLQIFHKGGCLSNSMFRRASEDNPAHIWTWTSVATSLFTKLTSRDWNAWITNARSSQRVVNDIVVTEVIERTRRNSSGKASTLDLKVSRV